MTAPDERRHGVLRYRVPHVSLPLRDMGIFAAELFLSFSVRSLEFESQNMTARKPELATSN